MGPRTPRLALGLAGLVLGLLAFFPRGAGAADQPRSPRVVVAAVAADGQPEGFPAGWHVAHTGTGRYRVTTDAGPAIVDVPSWEAIARVTIQPLGNGVEVSFATGGRAMDSAFAVTAILSP